MEIQAAVEVFINGITGVFAGITVLYIVIRLNALTAGREEAGKQG